MDEYNNNHHGPPVVDPSKELIGVANVFLRWHHLFCRTTPGKTDVDISTLRALSHRFIAIIEIICIIFIIVIIAIIDIII